MPGCLIKRTLLKPLEENKDTTLFFEAVETQQLFDSETKRV